MGDGVKKRGRPSHKKIEQANLLHQQRVQVEQAMDFEFTPYGNQVREQAPEARKEILTMRTKNLYLQADPAMRAMYDRRIGVRDLQSWLRNNPKNVSAQIL